MASYKVLQDIESEDKLLGPLTLRQFIYAAIVAVMLFLMFKLFLVSPFLAIPFLPPAALLAVLASPIGKDQSPEIWLLARIQFILKPQKRIWDQSGLKELVTITAPKKIEHALTNGLSQVEVKSRLQALANTIDSRGWAVKNVNVNLFAQPSYVLNQTDSDRLIDPTSIPQEVPNYDTVATDDVLDEQNSPTAQHFSQLIATSEQTHRQKIMTQMQQAAAKSADPAAAASAPPADYWFMNQTPQTGDPGQVAFTAPPVIAPGAAPVAGPAISKAEEEALLAKIHKEDNQPDPSYAHMRVIEPASSHKKKKVEAPKLVPMQPDNREQQTSPKQVDPAILGLANRNDLNVSTVSRMADKASKQDPPDEVVISLR